LAQQDEDSKLRPKNAFLLTGAELRRLMRQHHVTISTLAQHMDLPMKRIRFHRAHGFDATEGAVVRDWIEEVTGADPGLLSRQTVLPVLCNAAPKRL
jgi:hypothetical protein